MNLYLFNANETASTYGIGTYLKELTEAFKNSSIRVHIVHLHSDRLEFEIEKTDQTENWFIPEVKNDNTFSGPTKKIEGYLWNVIYLLRIHIKDTKDLVFHFNFNIHQLLAKELKTVFNCKTVATIHYLRWTLEFQGNLNQLYALKAKPKDQRTKFEKSIYATYKYESLLFSEADRLIALSQDMKHHLSCEYQLDPNKINIIPNGLQDVLIDNGQWTMDNEWISGKSALRKKWNIAPKEKIVLFTGRLHPVKGLLFLIRAFRKVLEIIPDCRLIIAGNGLYDIHFREAKDICTKITFTGLLEKNDLYELYQIADVGVVPSLFEPFGYVAVEMMMHGLPMVVTATSGLNEVVDDTCGLKIPIVTHPDSVEIDTDLLAEKIIYLLQHPAEARKMGQNGRKRYLNEYTSAIFLQNMMKLYESLCQ